MVTLKISELSVGDWVVWNGRRLLISSIYSAVLGFPHEVALIYPDGICASIVPVEDLDPIPITPEILEANGFVKWRGGLVIIDDEVSCRYEDGDLTIERRYRDDDEGVLVERRLVNIECLFVHQLQHALRLAGVEKEIVMPNK